MAAGKRPSATKIPSHVLWEALITYEPKNVREQILLNKIHEILTDRSDARILDVGCGSGDLPAFLVGRSPIPLTAVGVDLKLLHVRQVPAPVKPLVANVHHLPFAPRSFDVVTASLFLHHFDDHEVAGVLARLHALARRALVVNDLHRAAVPWLFGRTVFPLAFRSRVSVDDGLLSIRRAFRPAELRQAFDDAGIPRVQIRRRFPYRLVAIAEAAP
jgi:2-polyprenyl-3-methyl-5-hydroxy-6-metoxy-1,4-benzoquinol methylase